MSKMCLTCPFNCTEEADQVQNYGCLPSAVDIIQLKKDTGDNWACHSNSKRMCNGLKEWNSRELDYFDNMKDDPRPFDLSKGKLIVEEGVHYSLAPKKKDDKI